MPALGLSIPPSVCAMPCLQSRVPHLLPVGGNDADLLGGHSGAAPLAPAQQQLLQVVNQDLNFGRVEE